MKNDMFVRWIHNIFTTQEEEIDCGQLFEALSQFVDMEISGKDAVHLLPYVQQHLEQCPECKELYQALYDIAHLEAEDRLPEVNELVGEIMDYPMSRGEAR